MPGLSAVLARRIVYPLQERALGRPTFDYLDALERSQWLSREALEDLQRDKVQRLLRTALEHCPWHAQRVRAFSLADVLEKGSWTWDDFRRLPTMSKRDARENGEAMRWPDVPG